MNSLSTECCWQWLSAFLEYPIKMYMYTCILYCISQFSMWKLKFSFSAFNNKEFWKLKLKWWLENNLTSNCVFVGDVMLCTVYVQFAQKPLKTNMLNISFLYHFQTCWQKWGSVIVVEAEVSEVAVGFGAGEAVATVVGGVVDEEASVAEEVCMNGSLSNTYMC